MKSKEKKKKYETCDLMHGNICVSKPCICKGMSMSEKRKHGGKRQGSGRPKKKKSEKVEESVVMRVPKSLVKKFKAMIKEHRESHGRRHLK